MDGQGDYTGHYSSWLNIPAPTAVNDSAVPLLCCYMSHAVQYSVFLEIRDICNKFIQKKKDGLFWNELAYLQEIAVQKHSMDVCNLHTLHDQKVPLCFWLLMN